MWIESHKGDWVNLDKSKLLFATAGGVSQVDFTGTPAILGRFASRKEAKFALSNIMRAMNTGEYEALEYDEWSDTEEM